MFIRVVTILFALLILAIIALANADALRGLKTLHEIPGADKLGHFFLFGTLAFLLNLWITRPGIRLFGLPVARVSLFLIFFVTFEEATQLLLQSRSFDLADLLSDYAGIVLLGALGATIATRTRTVAEIGRFQT